MGIDSLNILVEQQKYVNADILTKTAKKVREVHNLPLSYDFYDLEWLLAGGIWITELENAYRNLVKEQKSSIIKELDTYARYCYLSTKPLYEGSDIKFIEYSQNKDIKQSIDNIIHITVAEYSKITKNPCYLVRNKVKGAISPITMKSALKGLILASESAHKNGIDVTEYLSRDLMGLNNSGLRYVTYKNHRRYSQRIPNAMNTLFLNTKRDIEQTINNKTGELLGFDCVQISVHQNPAVDHTYIQGHIFTLEEFDKMQNGLDFEDTDGVRYFALDRAIGEWNCRHIVTPIKLGLNSNQFSQEDLDNIIDKNDKGIVVNGKHYTLHEANSRVKELQYQIDLCNNGLDISKALGNDRLYREYKTKRSNYYNQYLIFKHNLEKL